MGELNGTSSHRTSPTLDENGSSLDWTCDMNCPMGGYAGNAETGPLFQRHVIEDLNHLLRANHGVLGGGSERAVRLSAIAPHASADPFPRHSFANLINDARTIAVRNDPWIRHPDVKRVFTFLNITWIHARKSDTNPNFARTFRPERVHPRPRLAFHTKRLS